MAQATSTTFGEIVLAGDLFGDDANEISLAPSGVDPGAQNPYSKIHVDAKGRTTWRGDVVYETDIQPHVPAASKSQKGIFVVGDNIDATAGTISIKNASSSAKGVFQLGYQMEINQSTGKVDVTVPTASASNKGVAQIGSGFDIASGVLSRSGFNFATGSVKGMVKVGANFNIDYGVISVPYATASVKGVASVDGSQFYLDTANNYLYTHACATMLYGRVQGFSSDFSIDGNGVLSYISPWTTTPATTSTLGGVKIGSFLFMTGDDALTVAQDASTSQKGFVEVGTGFLVESGVLSAALSTASNWGLICSGDPSTTGMVYNLTPISDGTPESGTSGLRFRRCDTSTPANLAIAGVVKSANMDNISVTNGVMDVGVNIPKKDTFNTYTKAQVVSKQTFVDTDWSKGSVFELIMTSNITSVPAPTNAVAGQVMTLIVTQDATGGRTLTGWNSVYKFNSSLTLSTAPNTTDLITIICKSPTEFYVLASKGYI